MTAIAPIAWGSTYFVTQRFLPGGVPLWGAAIRALPAGLVLLAVTRARPRGAWWWRSALLGAVNMGAFFGLVYVAAQRLPTSTASMVMANSPIALMLAAWAVVGERPRGAAVGGAFIGIAGAAVMLGAGVDGVDPLGLVASLAAMAVSAVGFVFATRWNAIEGAPPVIATTAWQLVAGGLILAPAAALVHGAPPAPDAAAVAGFTYVALVGTAVAFVAWFSGLRRLRAESVGLIGLLNPVTGVLLGTAVAGDRITPAQALGIALVFTGILVGRRTGARWGRRRTGPAPDSATSPDRVKKILVGSAFPATE